MTLLARASRPNGPTLGRLPYSSLPSSVDMTPMVPNLVRKTLIPNIFIKSIQDNKKSTGYFEDLLKTK
jgi:hypothetical protein